MTSPLCADFGRPKRPGAPEAPLGWWSRTGSNRRPLPCKAPDPSGHREPTSAVSSRNGALSTNAQAAESRPKPRTSPGVVQILCTPGFRPGCSRAPLASVHDDLSPSGGSALAGGGPEEVQGILAGVAGASPAARRSSVEEDGLAPAGPGSSPAPASKHTDQQRRHDGALPKRAGTAAGDDAFEASTRLVEAPSPHTGTREQRDATRTPRSERGDNSANRDPMANGDRSSDAGALPVERGPLVGEAGADPVGNEQPSAPVGGVMPRRFPRRSRAPRVSPTLSPRKGALGRLPISGGWR